MQMLSFVSSDQYDRLLRERKRYIVEKVFIGLHLVALISTEIITLR